MSFDGSVVFALADELNRLLRGGHISKISQPEKDAILLTVKNNREQYHLFLSANASLPLAYITKERTKAPLTAPNFCMLLRKHLSNAKILGISTPGLERIIRIETEHLDEMGDLSTRYLVIELMGKYSNIILLDNRDTIIDSIKRISHSVSSVREVLPNRSYFIPTQEGRKDVFTIDYGEFFNVISSTVRTVGKALYTSFIGFSPQISSEICYNAGIDSDISTVALTKEDVIRLFNSFSDVVGRLSKRNFVPLLYYENKNPKSFSVFYLNIYKNLDFMEFSNISELLENFYELKNKLDRIRQRSTDLKKIISTAISRTSNKLDIYSKQLLDTKKMDKFKLYGELITVYGYSVTDKERLICTDYNTDEVVEIPLDSSIPVMENAKKYFEKYSRLKRTFENVSVLKASTEEELYHLESIRLSLEIAETDEDLAEIRNELENSGYVKKTSSARSKTKNPDKSKPLHFISSDGFDIYVGKNNYQNDYLTFKLAAPSDWWFHVKKRPGSHVLLVSNGKEIPDRTFIEAGKLAVHFSSANSSISDTSNRHEVDYVMKKEIKKPNGAKPGFVVYYTNYSLTTDSDISNLKQV